MKCAWIVLGIVCEIAAFGQTVQPSFEVASLKVSKDTSWHDRSDIGFIVEHGGTLKDLVGLAFDVKEYQVTGGPKWVDTDRWDIDAKAAGPAKDPELSRMLQTLLAERFHLEVHRETKPFPGYALVVVKGGIKAKPAADSSHPSSHSHNGTLTAKAIQMDEFAQFLARRTATPVVDATGLSAPFDFNMQWNLQFDRTGPPSATEMTADPKTQPLFTALEEQLGLRLEPRKVPVEMIVVDRAEKPTLN